MQSRRLRADHCAMSVPEPGQDVMASTDRGLQMCTLTGRRILLTCHQGGNASQVAERAATAGQQAKCTCTLQWETGAQQRGLCYRQEFWAAPVLLPSVSVGGALRRHLRLWHETAMVARRCPRRRHRQARTAVGTRMMSWILRRQAEGPRAARGAGSRSRGSSL